MDGMIEKFSLLLRFCTVGVGNTIIDFCFFFLLIKMNVPYLSAQLIAYSAGVINSFIWNRYWTFQQKKKIQMVEVIRFVLINILALITTNILLVYFYEILEMAMVRGKVMSTVGGMMITFLGSKLWVFQNNKVRE